MGVQRRERTDTMSSEGSLEVECSRPSLQLRGRYTLPRRHSVKNTWRQFRGSLRLLPRRGLAVSPSRVQAVDSSPDSGSVAEEAQADLDDDTFTSSSQCSSRALGRQNRALVHSGDTVLRPRKRARSECSWSSCSASVSPCSPARSRSPSERPISQRHEPKGSRQNYGSLSRCEEKHFAWARNLFCGERKRSVKRHRKHSKRHRCSSRAESEDLPEEEALLRSPAPKAKALESPEAQQQLSEAEPEPEMQASQDEVEMSAAAIATGAAKSLESSTTSSMAVTDQGVSRSEPQQACDELAATTAVTGIVNPVDNEALCREPTSSIAGRAQLTDGEQAKDSDEELYLSDLEGMLEESGNADRASNATTTNLWPVLQTQGTQKQTWPEPEGEAAELLAALRSRAELLNPGDYWLADTCAWDLEALREDVAVQQDALEVGQLEAQLSAELDAAAHAAAPVKPLPPTTGSSGVSASTSCYLVRQRQWQARKRARRKRPKMPLKGKAARVEVRGLGFYEDSQGDKPSHGSTSAAAETPSDMGFFEDSQGDRTSHASTGAAAETPSDMEFFEDSQGDLASHGSTCPAAETPSDMEFFEDSQGDRPSHGSTNAAAATPGEMASSATDAKPCDRPSHGSTSSAAATPGEMASSATDAKQVELAKTSLLSRLDALICKEVFGGEVGSLDCFYHCCDA